MTPTDEQYAVLAQLSSTKSNLMLDALAGTGKSSTLSMIDKAAKEKSCLYVVYNKSAKEKAEKQQKEESAFRSTTNIRTINGVGYRVWMNSVSGIDLNGRKMLDIISSEMEGLKGEDREIFWDVVNGCRMAKALGYLPDTTFPNAKRLITREAFHARLEDRPSSLVADFIDRALVHSAKDAYKGHIDFDDQVYMPALFGGTFPRYALVMVDERQDFNPVNDALLKKLCKSGTRLVAVGDPYQSIYGFRGAIADSMDKCAEEYSCTRLPLSVSFRCPQAIVEAAQWRVPHFKWVKPGGIYKVLPSLSADNIPDGAAILCRNNAPLFSLAFRLLIAGRAVSVAGSDIGPRIARIMRKFGDDEISKETVLDRIEEWLVRKLETSQDAKGIHDMAESMRVFANKGENLGQAIAYIDVIFKSRGTIKLSTIHKAKGAEWEIVYLLDTDLMNGYEQDLNLRYVGQTRSLNECYEIKTTGLLI